MPDFKKLEEMLPNMSKPDKSPFDWFTFAGPFSLNGYIVIPEQLPLDYYDEFYNALDTDDVGGLTFGGYFSMVNGVLTALYLEQGDIFKDWKLTEEQIRILNKARNKSIRAIGFDDNHIEPNRLDAEEGANYISKQLKEMLEQSNDD